MNASNAMAAELTINPNLISIVATPSHPSVEPLRALRTHVMSRHIGLGHRALAICAASAGVGCTFVALNLAAALSQVGLNTLLIDADMRQPSVNKLLGLRQSPPGLRQYLAASEGSYLQYTKTEVLPGLSILFSGGQAPDAQELLAGARFAELMDTCLRDFDATIIDTPPANVCSDESRICNVVSYGLIVARRNHTYVKDVKVLAEQLKADHAQIIGTVLNNG